MEQQPNQDPNQQQNYPPQMTWEGVINDHITKTRGWLMFLGVFAIVYAALVTLMSFGFGIIFAWIPFIMGLFLINASNRAKTFLMSGSQADLADYHKQLKNFFVTNGILLIVGLALMVIFIIIALVVGIHYNPGDFSKNFNF
jgi:hypothetical protein